jgi:hypothetical protein
MRKPLAPSGSAGRHPGVNREGIETGCVPRSSTFFAQIDNERAAAWLQINLSTRKFPTVEARKAEIVRQLSH